MDRPPGSRDRITQVRTINVINISTQDLIFGTYVGCLPLYMQCSIFSSGKGCNSDNLCNGDCDDCRKFMGNLRGLILREYILRTNYALLTSIGDSFIVLQIGDSFKYCG